MAASRIKKCRIGKTEFESFSPRGSSCCKSKIIFIFYRNYSNICPELAGWRRLSHKRFFLFSFYFQRFAGFIRKKCINSASPQPPRKKLPRRAVVYRKARSWSATGQFVSVYSAAQDFSFAANNAADEKDKLLFNNLGYNAGSYCSSTFTDSES